MRDYSEGWAAAALLGRVGRRKNRRR